MSESEEPDRQAELAIPSEFMIREMERAQRMMRYYQPQIRQIEQAQRLFRKNEHLIRHAQQAQRFFQENERLIRQAQEVAQAAELFARIANWPKINIGPALPYPLRLAYAMDGQMRELLSPRPAAHQRSAALNVNVATTATAEVAAAGGLALSPTVFVSDGDAATASESGSVEELDSRRRILAGLSGGQIFALVFIWLIAYALPIYLYSQSPIPSTLIDADLATFAIAYEITCRILDKRK